MKKIFSIILAALLLSAMASFAAADETAAAETAAAETAAAETEAAEELVSDENHFYGELVDTGVKNVAPYGLENVVIGTVMGAGDCAEGADYAKAFDGDINTWWAATVNSWATHMLVLKADEPVAPKAFVVSSTTDGAGTPTRFHIIFHSYIQGSNDGVTWDNLYYFEDDYIWYSEDYAEGGAPYYVAVPEAELGEYTYFRYINNDDGAASLSEFAVLTEVPAAPEAPATEETAAPETEAPEAAETEAPEVAETAAPETEAPAADAEVDAPAEEAPATFDAGIIAAAVAAVSAAGYAIARKRK
ncbi:MAG: hypothetical protein E7638_07225 [Ruminococcaceae bacterium]|nr:hypothetical protein [Oscillospiraceae bacterium]